MTDEISRLGDSLDLANELYPATPGDMLDDPEIQLITDYLCNELPAERVAEVRWRLEHDEAFRQLAAPLVLAWSVPPRWEREPMPRAELVKSWDEFTKRAGFVHQRAKARRRRRRWMLGLLVAVVATTVAILLPDGRPTWPDMEPLPEKPDSAGWLLLGNGARAKLEPGAKLFRTKPGAPVGSSVVLRLEGSARFVSERQALRAAGRDSRILTVYTDAGSIYAAGDADFVVRARGDTTDVEAFRRPSSRPARHREELDMVVLTALASPGGVLDVVAGEHARLQVGSAPLWLRKVTGVVPGAAPPTPIVTEGLKEGFVPFSAAPDSSGWMTVARGSRVRLDPGARLLRPSNPDEHKPYEAVWLEGSARFIRSQPGGRSPLAEPGGLMIMTSAGMIAVNLSADVRVNARGDTTDVELLRREAPAGPARTAVDSMRRMPEFVLLMGVDPPTGLMMLGPGDAGRLVLGFEPVKVRDVPDGLDRNPILRWLFK